MLISIDRSPAQPMSAIDQAQPSRCQPTDQAQPIQCQPQIRLNPAHVQLEFLMKHEFGVALHWRVGKSILERKEESHRLH